MLILKIAHAEVINRGRRWDRLSHFTSHAKKKGKVEVEKGKGKAEPQVDLGVAGEMVGYRGVYLVVYTVCLLDYGGGGPYRHVTRKKRRVAIGVIGALCPFRIATV